MTLIVAKEGALGGTESLRHPAGAFFLSFIPWFRRSAEADPPAAGATRGRVK
jgi:hypothetical protein